MIRNNGRRGVVLVTVLWSIALLSALAMAASVTFRGFVGIATVGRDSVQADALLTAGLEMVAAGAASADDAPLSGNETSVDLSTGSVRASFSDEGGRIDVGKAPVELIASLLRSVGVPAGDADAAAQRMVERRKRDAAAAAPRPSDNAAGSAGAAVAPPFADLLDAAQVGGLAPSSVAAMAPLATVFGSETVNPLTAPAGVIAALPGVDPAHADAFLAARRSTPTDAARLTSVLGGGQRYLAVKPQHVVSVDLTAALFDGYARAAHAVIVLLPNDNQPYRVLVWKPLSSASLR